MSVLGGTRSSSNMVPSIVLTELYEGMSQSTWDMASIMAPAAPPAETEGLPVSMARRRA